jgi:aminoglycoside phosphotransferase (APT) family kinase protein
MPTPTETGEIREPFRRWLAALWSDASDLELGEFSGAATGYSAQTLIVPVRFRPGAGGETREEKVVVRIENLGPPIYPAQTPDLDVEIDIQYRAMRGVASVSKLPLAGLIGYEADARVLGAPFFVMEYVAGETPLVDPPYPKEGFFVDAQPAERRRMIEGGLRLLAELHTLDWRAAGLDWLIAPGTTPGTLAQLDIWERYLREYLGDRVNPTADAALAWLRANVPPNLEPGLSWGDARPGNLIWRDFEPVCVTDWENVAIAPPELDIGWWLMFDRTCHEFSFTPVPRLEGEPSIDEQRALYANLTGRDPEVIRYFELFAAVRYIAIITRMMNLYVERGVLPADQMVWLNNPPCEIAKALYAELA